MKREYKKFSMFSKSRKFKYVDVMLAIATIAALIVLGIIGWVFLSGNWCM